jgi:hypothetical protein
LWSDFCDWLKNYQTDLLVPDWPMEEYENKNNQKVLETLLAYSAYDAVDLEHLMVLAYNLKLKGTPFEDSHQLPLPKSPEIPFKVDLETIENLDYWDLVEKGYHSRSINEWLYSDWSIQCPFSNLEG